MIPRRGTVADPHILVSVTIGLVLIIGFVVHALHRTEHPLIDMRLFANRVVGAASAAMLFFAAGFFGASLLFPSYFQQLLHLTPLQSGMRLIPQGVGAMLAMPVAGQVMDRRGPGRIVLAGISLTCIGMGLFGYGTWKQVAYAPVLLVSLAIIGIGMGCTFMTLSAAAVQTLRPEQVARGSTLINVNQRLGGSIGTALTSVILTNQFNRSTNVAASNKVAALQEVATKRGVPVPRSAMPPQALLPDFVHNVVRDLSHGYTVVFLTVVGLILLTFIPAAFLPKRPVQEAPGRTAARAADTSAQQPWIETTRVDPLGREHQLQPALGWRARFRGIGEPGASFDAAARAGTFEQRPWTRTNRGDPPDGKRRPPAAPSGAPEYHRYALPPAVGWRTGVNGNVNGNGAAGAGFDRQRWVGTTRVDRRAWPQHAGAPLGTARVGRRSARASRRGIACAHQRKR
jgi:MFS family permease